MINDFRRWLAWSPWEHFHESVQRRFTGSGAGVGALYHWHSPDDVAGSGRMEITSSTLERVELMLTYSAPLAAENTFAFDINPVPGGTRLVWTITGQLNPIMKTMGRSKFTSEIAKDFDRGLLAIKHILEGLSPRPAGPGWRLLGGGPGPGQRTG